jgi:excisionase family DNA binding protein
MTILAYFAFYSAVSLADMTKQTFKADILTIQDVSEYLKVTERTIYRLAAAKKIPAFKVGGSWRFSRADIDIWIKQQSMDAIEPTKKDSGEPS